MDLKEIRQIVRKRWTFDSSEYIDLHAVRSNQGGVERLVRGHVLKHMMKSVGKIAEIEEDDDHSHSKIHDSKERMRALIGKMLINLMQLAESYGISNKELAKFIHEEGAKPA
jgi:hypothetical protein